jgi:predicted GNAT superfamily acetyltransferase
VAWSTSGPLPAADHTRPIPPGTIAVPTPEDIVVLRRTDPSGASAWRLRLREELGAPLTHGATVVGFTRTGDYLVLPLPET